MKALSIRGLPDDVYQALCDWAKINRRSLQEQAKLILEREMRLVNGGRTHRARQWRRRLQGRKWGDLVEAVREERTR